MSRRAHVLVAIGTRPEALKLSPLVRALREVPDFRLTTCVTAQHRELLDDALRTFGVVPDVDLDLMVPDQDLNALTARVLGRMREVLAAVRPDLVVVQGDTTTAMATALAAYFAGVEVAHVEAGLRTYARDPWPEEMNRRLITQLATLHFAPTARARDNLRAEGVGDVEVVGNTGIDAVCGVVPVAAPFGDGSVLLTCHRRENQQDDFARAAATFRALTSAFPGLRFVLPLHPSPRVAALRGRLDGTANLELVGPLDYPTMLGAIRDGRAVVTDSGGVQEEASWFGTPCAVIREVTDRPESVESGHAVVVGLDPARAVEGLADLLERDIRPSAIFGDGHASCRIVERLRRHLYSR